MKKIISYAFMALCLLYTNKNIAQESTEATVDLDEVVLSIPFNDNKESSVIHSAKNSILGKINRNYRVL